MTTTARRNPIRRRSSAAGYFARLAALPSTAPGPRPALLASTNPAESPHPVKRQAAGRLMGGTDSTLRAFVRGLADSGDDRAGPTYDDDPTSDRSVAYNLGRTYGDRATFRLEPLIDAVSDAEDGTPSAIPYAELAAEAETTATALRALCDDARTCELLDAAVLAIRAHRPRAVDAAAAT